MPKKEQHHFVPRFYLAGFVDPTDRSSLWLYDKSNSTIARSSPKDAGRRRHYHSIPMLDGTRNLQVEEALAKGEDQTAPIWRKLIAAQPLDNKERSVVSHFLALLIVRVPAFRDAVEQFNGAVAKDVAQLMAARGGFDAIFASDRADAEIAAQVREALVRGDFDVLVRPHASLPALLVAPRIAEIIHRMTWVVLESRGRHFVTSDNPVVYMGPPTKAGTPSPIGLAHRDIQVTVPLSATAAMFASWDGDGQTRSIRAKDSLIRSINRRTAAAALRFVYASENSEQLLNLVMKFKDSGPRLEIS